MTTTKTSPQLTPEILDVMTIQGRLVEYYVARGMNLTKAQDFAQEAVHTFLESNIVKPAYQEQYSALESI